MSVAAVLCSCLTTHPAYQDGSDNRHPADSLAHFKKTVAPVINDFCVRCHDAQDKKGGIDFDKDDPTALVKDKELWLKALKMIQAGHDAARRANAGRRRSNLPRS